MKIHMILLAAGNGRRFGGNKLLSPLNGKPMYLYLADRLERITDPDIGEKIVVSRYEEILRELGMRGCRTVYNGEPERGISHSIRLGIEELEKHSAKEDAVCFFVCDQPYLRRETIENFFRAYRESKKGIGCVGAGERLGNPVIFSGAYLEELRTLTGDTGGKQIVRRHLEDVFVFPAEELELEDIDYRRKPLVIVRGGGDLASGTIYRLYREGYRLLVLETAAPACIRRQVAFCEAVYEGETEVEGVSACRIETLEETERVWAAGKIPVYVDPAGTAIGKLHPGVVIDAIIAKKNLGTRRDMAPLTIALGPGFEAGKDTDVVIETMRGADLGRIYREGTALANTGIPGVIAGYSRERVIHAPASGRIRSVRQVGDRVKTGEVLAWIGDCPVYATMDGILRGLIREGFEVTKGLKIMDIDPRVEELNNCFLISDKAKRIAASVYETVREWEEREGR